MASTLVKQPSESRLYDFEFANLLASGVTLSSVQSLTADSAGLTLGSATVSGTRVQVRIGAGTHGATYKLTCIAVDSQSNVLEAEGYLSVQDL